MKNKQVKQMMGDGYELAANRIGYRCARKVDLERCARFMRGSLKFFRPSIGSVSLTANQLKSN